MTTMTDDHNDNDNKCTVNTRTNHDVYKTMGEQQRYIYRYILAKTNNYYLSRAKQYCDCHRIA